MNFFKKIKSKLHRKLGFKPKFGFDFNPEIPDRVEPDFVHIVGDIYAPWLLLIVCPCGCKKLIHLNLLKEASPCWSYKIYKKGITIKPSIWRNTGCKSHFNIRYGNIVWVK